MPKSYSITREPIYLVTVGMFALITTPALMFFGQGFIWPLIQSLALTLFMGTAIRHGHFTRAALVLGLWLGIQFLLTTFLAYAMSQEAQAIVPDGFNRLVQFREWFYIGSSQPDALLSAPLQRIFEIIGLLVGTVVTAGFVGIWILLRLVTLAGFHSGLLIEMIGAPFGFIAAMQPWALMRLAGYAGIVLVLSEPLLTGNMTPSFLLTKRRRWLMISAGIVLLGLILEMFLPSIWRSVFQLVI